MSMDLKETGDHAGFWTNEKHVKFLNSIEAAFVQTMLENGGCSLLMYATDLRLPLDRYLPDSSESTRDLESKKKTRKPVHFHHDLAQPNITNVVSSDVNAQRRSSQPYDASQDQVVPQIGDRKGDKVVAT
ncbi:PREDICTED: uncharacterized protein LOC104596144 [Nelumbo nucifera]|uniref:Uncharacterized protein LOC104596144 n=1 Tax=Nelumbo nucifera TaxID=4432 RepID=A0A1U7ZQ14_NELNU|nr:PREDICTED: uncharacterized protein LOC104596144 [Nelumbo nucifera]